MLADLNRFQRAGMICALMFCPHCGRPNSPDAHRCSHCRSGLAVALLEVMRGSLSERAFSLKPRSYLIGRATHNDLALPEPSVSKVHAKINYADGSFSIEDQGSLHGIYLNGVRVDRGELKPGTLIQLGNLTLKFSSLSEAQSTADVAEYPWGEQQQLLLSVVQTLNSTLVLSDVLEQVLDAVMRITHAERGFVLLAEASDEDSAYESIAGLRLRLGRRRGLATRLMQVEGISTSVVRKALSTGETVATGNALADPNLGHAPSVVLMDLRTIVCIPLCSPKPGDEAGGSPVVLGAIYVDNQDTSAPFTPESLRTAEALARHAALAIQNAQLFEREGRTIEELRRTQQQLLHSEKLATIGKMAAGLAHELNTPLTYIVGNLELLESGPLTSGQKEKLAAMADGAERIRVLAQSLLAFSRSPRREEKVALDPNVLIRRSLDLCRYQTLEAKVEVETDLDSMLPPVLGVAGQIETALINLIVNAVQAMAADGGGRLTVRSRSLDGEIEISISDSGPGIPESIQATIFEPFFTTKPEGKGTGLGLSTVLTVMEQHGGRIDFSTRARRGTTFRVLLPAASTTSKQA